MNNIEKILSETELTISDIVHVRLYLTDLTELPKLNEVYNNYFKHPLPAPQQ